MNTPNSEKVIKENKKKKLVTFFFIHLNLPELEDQYSN